MHTLLIFIESDCEKKLRVMRRVKISIIFYICNKLSKYLLHSCVFLLLQTMFATRMQLLLPKLRFNVKYNVTDTKIKRF